MNAGADTLIWSGVPSDFDEAYEWAGKQHLMEARDSRGEHVLSAYDPITGWVRVPPGATIVKSDLGFLTVHADKPEMATATGDSDEETKQTKDSPDTGIETKPALITDPANATATPTTPAKTAKTTTAPPAK